MFIIYRLSFSKIKRIILSFFLILFLILYFFISIFSFHDEDVQTIISEGQLAEEKHIGDYTYRHYIGPPYDFGVFQIYQGEELLFTSDIGYWYWLGEEEGLFQNGDDITGDGIPNLVVMHNAGGNSSFNQSCYVFSLGEQFRQIQVLPHGEFVDLNQDGKLECLAYQPGFTFWHACHAGSPLPELVYEYCDYEYLIAPALMYRSLPAEEEINQMVEKVKGYCARAKQEEWSDDSCWRYKDVYLVSAVWRYMLDLMYTGHPDSAYDFLDKVWPEGEKGKNFFIYDFEEKLNDTLWPALEHLFARIAEVKKENPTASLEKEITQGVIRIWSYPENPKVYLENEYLGEAPLSTGLLDPDPYHLRIELTDYHEADITTEVVPLHVRQVQARLKQKVGNSTLYISTTPEKAEIYLNDTFIGLTPLTVEKVLAKEHKLFFNKPGYHSKEKIFWVFSKTDQEISVELEEDNTVYARDVIWIPIVILLFLFLL